MEAIVGHSNPAMTRHYSHVGELAASAAVAALPSMLHEGETKSLPIHAERQPLPSWALELVKGMNGKNWQHRKASLLKE